MTVPAEAAPSWPDCAFWTFSLAFYGEREVAAACLALQDEHGLDVNLLLAAAWLARHGRALEAPLASRLRACGEMHQRQVTGPLRQARRGLGAIAGARGLAALRADRRRALLALELDCEHLEQLALAALMAVEAAAGGAGHGPGDVAAAPLFRANLAMLYPERPLPEGPLATVERRLAG